MKPTVTPAQEKRNQEIKEFEQSDLYRESFEPLISYLRNSCKNELNAISSRKLESIIGIKSGVALRLLVRHARMCHIPVASGGHGYWMASGYQEYARIVASMKSRRNALSEVIFEMEQCFPDRHQENLLQPAELEYPEEFEIIQKFCRHYCHKNRGMADYGVPNVFTVDKVKAHLVHVGRSLAGNNQALDEIIKNHEGFVQVGQVRAKGSYNKITLFTIPEYSDSVKSYLAMAEMRNG